MKVSARLNESLCSAVSAFPLNLRRIPFACPKSAAYCESSRLRSSAERIAPSDGAGAGAGVGATGLGTTGSGRVREFRGGLFVGGNGFALGAGGVSAGGSVAAGSGFWTGPCPTTGGGAGSDGAGITIGAGGSEIGATAFGGVL